MLVIILLSRWWSWRICFEQKSQSIRITLLRLILPPFLFNHFSLFLRSRIITFLDPHPMLHCSLFLLFFFTIAYHISYKMLYPKYRAKIKCLYLKYQDYSINDVTTYLYKFYSAHSRTFFFLIARENAETNWCLIKYRRDARVVYTLFTNCACHPLTARKHAALSSWELADVEIYFVR